MPSPNDPPSGPFVQREVYDLLLLHQAKHIGFTLELRTGRRGHAVKQGTPETLRQFTIHRAEVRKLCERLLDLLAKPDGSTAMVEGAYLGPPPAADELVENLDS